MGSLAARSAALPSPTLVTDTGVGRTVQSMVSGHPQLVRQRQSGSCTIDLPPRHATPRHRGTVDDPGPPHVAASLALF